MAARQWYGARPLGAAATRGVPSAPGRRRDDGRREEDGRDSGAPEPCVAFHADEVGERQLIDERNGDGERLRVAACLFEELARG